MEIQDYLEKCEHDAGQYAAVPVPVAAEFLKVTREAIRERIRSKDLEAVTLKGEGRTWKLVRVSSLLGFHRKIQKRGNNMIKQVVSFLEDAALLQEPMHYGVLMEKVGLSSNNPRHRGEIGIVLGEASTQSLKRGFMLSALAIQKNSGHPNDSFFQLAIELGLMDEDEDQEDFWKKQCMKIYQYYAKKKKK